MRAYIIFALLCFTLPIISQEDSLKEKAEHGNLTIQEFKELINYGDITIALPTLIKWEKELSSSKIFNEADYSAVIQWLVMIYNNQGQYSKSQTILSNAISVFNDKGTTANSKFTRELWLFRGLLEHNLNDYDQAIEYWLAAQKMYCEVNDKGDSYAVLLSNLGTAYLLKEDFLIAKLFLDEAVSIYEANHGDMKNCHDAGLLLLSNQGLLYTKIKDYNFAEKCFATVIKNHDGSQTTNEAYQKALNNLSTIYTFQGRLKESLPLLQQLKDNNPNNQYIYIYRI